jgi:hypothetical protein
VSKDFSSCLKVEVVCRLVYVFRYWKPANVPPGRGSTLLGFPYSSIDKNRLPELVQILELAPLEISVCSDPI